MVIASFNERYPGWSSISDQILSAVQASDSTIDQLKEKFGGIRCYFSPENLVLERFINIMEDVSLETCQVCGAKAGQVGKSWTRTLCKEHEHLAK